jgi:hypothetical protein
MIQSTLIIQLLQEIDTDDSIEVTDNIYTRTHPLISAVIYLANNYLTGDDNYYPMKYIKEAGFDIYPGEQDSFGWLIGCIKLQRGIIVFG